MKRAVKWILFVSFLDVFAVSLLFPSVLPHFKELGASNLFMGCITSIYSLTQLISGPVISLWSDKTGRQRILIFSLLLVGCYYAVLGLLDSLILILLLRAIIGIFKHVQILIRAMITDKLSREQQTFVFGHLKLIIGLSLTLGPAIGGNLAELENGFSYVCYCVSVLFVVNSVVVYFFLDDLPKCTIKETTNVASGKETKKSETAITNVFRILANVDWPMYRDIFALKFFMNFAFSSFNNNHSVKLQEKFQVTPKVAGYAISFQSFVDVLAGLSIGSLSAKFYKNDVDYKKRNFHGYALAIVAFLGIAATDRLSIFLICSVWLKSAHMFLRIVLMEMTTVRCPPNQRSTLIGAGNSISNIARLVTPLLSGLVEDIWGLNSANYLAATVATLGVIVSFRLRESHQKTS